MEWAVHEVWAKVAWAAIDTAKRGGLSTEGFFEGLSFDGLSVRLMRRVPWKDYCILLARIEERAGGPEACARLLEAEYHESFSEIRAVVSSFISPKVLIRGSVSVTAVLFPPIDAQVFDAGPDRMRIEFRLRAGAYPSAPFFRGSIGTIGGATRHLGLPSSGIEADISDHHGIYTLTLPPSRTLLARGRRVIEPRLHFAPRFVLGLDEDGSPVTTTIGDARARTLPDRVDVAVEHWELTGRQGDVLGVLALGRSNKEIASELGCAENTVELHVTQLLRRTGASSRAELIARFWSEI